MRRGGLTKAPADLNMLCGRCGAMLSAALKSWVICEITILFAVFYSIFSVCSLLILSEVAGLYVY